LLFQDRKPVSLEEEERVKRINLIPILLTLAASSWLEAADEKNKAASQQPLVKITPAQRAKLDRKLRKIAEQAAAPARPGVFNASPETAETFYANQRTGRVAYRGPRPTPNRPLNTSRYVASLSALKAMPSISSSTKQVSTGTNLAVAPAAAGAALGTWTNLGPNNQGGRTRALLIDPVTPNTMYAGGVDGGVWKSTNGGLNWSTNTDLALTNLAVTTLAFQPGNSNVIYAGTGEGLGNGDAIRGAGIFKSVDAGATWIQLASTDTPDFHYVGKILVSPRNPQRVWAATRTGVWRSLNGGSTWTNTLISPSNGCTDMAIQERRAIGFVFASCGRSSGQGTIWRALDSDSGTWTSVMSLPGQGRSSIAVAPSNESIIYVVAAQRTAFVPGAGPGLGGLHGVYRSVNNGTTFTTQRRGDVAFANTQAKINQLLLSNPIIALLSECGQGTSSLLNQGWYDNVVAVDPLDSEKVWVGGIDMWRSDNGGVDWGAASYWWFTKGVDSQYSHADRHAIVFHPNYNGSSNKIVYFGHDGGVDRIDDARAPVNTTLAQLCGAPVAGSTVWTDRSSGYVTTQFYHGTPYPAADRYFGGLQDNGTMRGTAPGLGWTSLRGGDGGYTALDTRNDFNPNNDVLFLENTGNSLQKSVDGGANFNPANIGLAGLGFQFIAPFEMNQGNKQHIWTGGFDIWFSADQAGTWTRMTDESGTCGFGAVSAIAAHPLDPNRVLVGMSDGCFHYNTDAQTPVAGLWPGGDQIANGVISSMAWDPNNLEVAYATVSIFDNDTVLKTEDHGQTWTPMMGTGLTALPRIPARSVVVNPADSNQVFVGTDLGVFTSVDGGASWYRENTGFANVSVNSLRINANPPYKLFAFTHGRGAWVTDLADNGLNQTSPKK
jgi:hypothetical protein